MSRLRRISRALAKSGAALALAGATAGCAVQTSASPAAAVKPLAPATSSQPAPPASPSTSAASPSPSAAVTTAKPAPPSTAPSTTAPSTRAAVPSQVVAKAPAGDPCSAEAVACVSLSRQEAWFVRDGSLMRGPIRVATGRYGYGTELGTFSVYRKNYMWYSTIYNNAPMPYSVFFDGGEAFHQGSVYVRSHGCVHLGDGDAAWVYNFLHIGDEVEVVS